MHSHDDLRLSLVVTKCQLNIPATKKKGIEYSASPSNQDTQSNLKYGTANDIEKANIRRKVRSLTKSSVIETFNPLRSGTLSRALIARGKNYLQSRLKCASAPRAVPIPTLIAAAQDPIRHNGLLTEMAS